MENTWLAQAKRLQALASTGLHFCTDDFERERLEEVREQKAAPKEAAKVTEVTPEQPSESSQPPGSSQAEPPG